MPAGGTFNRQLAKDAATRTWQTFLNSALPVWTHFLHDSERQIAVEKIELYYVTVGTGTADTALTIRGTVDSTLYLVGTAAAGYAPPNGAAATAPGTIVTVTLQTDFDGVIGEGGIRDYGPIIPVNEKLAINFIVSTPGDWEAWLQIYYRFLDNSNE